jgi:Holliday junction resolvase-like predicted endonuclease
VVGSNFRLPDGELDLLALDGRERVAVEVRARLGGPDPVDAADPSKRARVGSLARRAGASRVDVIGIRIDREGFDLHWVPGIG